MSDLQDGACEQMGRVLTDLDGRTRAQILRRMAQEQLDVERLSQLGFALLHDAVQQRQNAEAGPHEQAAPAHVSTHNFPFCDVPDCMRLEPH